MRPVYELYIATLSRIGQLIQQFMNWWQEASEAVNSLIKKGLNSHHFGSLDNLEPPKQMCF
jgi:hypothetical protein